MLDSCTLYCASSVFVCLLPALVGCTCPAHASHEYEYVHKYVYYEITRRTTDSSRLELDLLLSSTSWCTATAEPTGEVWLDQLLTARADTRDQ
jgi:hypothetical protein